MEHKEYKRWAKEKPMENGGTERIEVCEVENGYIKTVTIEGEIDGKYQYECKKYISEDNPMDEKSVVEKLAEALGARIKK